jgi:pyruvate dehydrogenase E1 component alpha subunit
MALPDLPREDLIDFFARMLLIRRFEERLVLLSMAGHRFGHFHLYCGEETTGVPLLSLVDGDDYMLTTHRNHGHLLARGGDPARLMAEILGRATGTNQGKGGTLHLTQRELGFLSTSAIVGGVAPMSTGAALAAKAQGKGKVSVCLFGDGALEEGAAPEAFNMAALWKLPIIYACENNSFEAWPHEKRGYSSSTIAAKHITDLAAAFQIPTITVDGTDVQAVYEASAQAVRRARRGEGPTFVEYQTIRYPGTRPLWPTLDSGETDLAYAWDPASIPEAFHEWHAEQDGLLRYARDLLAAGAASQEALLEIDRAARARIDEAAAFALDSPFPEPATALEGVFA